MKPIAFFRSILLLLLCLFFSGVPPVSADSSNARIIRLSLVEGDVRFARDVQGDPLADSKTISWEAAEANLPISKGYAVATDNGRAQVEFENGTLAFLSEHTILQFYDLTLDDGSLITRLVLRQGSASFHVNTAGDDYFSVTGGDFTVEATTRTTFRVNNFDDGSNVDVLTGRVSVLHKKISTPLAKGQSLSMTAGDDTSVTLGRVPASDDFDQWVSGRIESSNSAGNSVLPYVGSYSYAPGFANLYTYGSWSSCGGYGYGWRPFGAGFNWSPFSSGQWIWDPAFGWTFVSSAAWGWAPYHYGGWLFDAGCGGWFYSPRLYGQFFSAPNKKRIPIVHAPRPLYRAATAVFVRQNGKLGVVPMHPLDEKGKTPLNLEHGVFPVESGIRVRETVIAAQNGEKWETLKSAPRDAFTSGLPATAGPVHVTRTLQQGDAGLRTVAVGKDSSITYDPMEHRFVNSNAPRPPAASASNEPVENAGRDAVVAGRNAAPPPSATVANARASSTVASSRSAAPPSRSMTPPPPSRNSGFAGGGGSSFGGSSGSSSRSSSSSASFSGSSSHASSGSSSSGSSGGRSH